MEFFNNLMDSYRLVYGRYFSNNLEKYLSEEGEEMTAINTSARFSRGNVPVQNKRGTSQRVFDQELKSMEARAARHSHSAV